MTALEEENARLRAALERIARSHPAFVTRGGGPAPWLIAKAALLNVQVPADIGDRLALAGRIIADWAETEPALRRWR